MRLTSPALKGGVLRRGTIKEIKTMMEKEQPYKLPDDWQWIEWKNLGKFISGTGFKKEYQKFTEYEIPFYKVNSLNFSDEQGYIYEKSNTINENIRKLLKAKIIPTDSIIFAKIGEAIRLNRKVLNKVPCCIDNNMMAFVPNKVSFKYVYYWSHNVDFYKYAKGSIVPSIRKSELEKILLPVPSLDEQKRIVEIIESLFAKLDRSRIIAQKIVDDYQLRRGKLLHETFKGELIKCNSQKMTINSVCKSLIYGTSKKSDKSGKVIVIRMGNLQGGEIDWSNLAYSNDEEEIEKYHLSAGDVLFNRTNSAELVGKTSIYRGEYPAIYAGYLIKLDYDPNIIIGDYLNYILNSPEAKDYCQRVKTNGVNQSNINAKRIGAFEIPVPDLEEQREIVRHLDSLLTKEKQTKELAEQTLQKIDLMKKTILARAFRGKL